MRGGVLPCELDHFQALNDRLELSLRDGRGEVCPQGAQTDPADAIRRADRALYAAKARGRNRVVADR